MQRINFYPTFGQILRVALPALILAQFAVWPLVSRYSVRAGLIAAEACMVAFMVLFIYRRRLVPEDLLLLNATPISTLIITGWTAAGATLLIAEFDLLCLQLLSSLGLNLPLFIQRNLIETQLVRSLPELFMGLLAVALFPGLCEELFFRGFVFTGLYVHRGPSAAAIGSALLFAIAHFNPWQLPTLLIFGLFLGMVVYWTHSIYPAILAHAINNLISMAGTNLRAYLGLEVFNPHRHFPLSVILAAAIILISGAWLLHRQPTIMPLPNRRDTWNDRPTSQDESPSPN